MKIGLLLPTFRVGAEDALTAAGQAADAELDGVFAYDHLWPMGHRERPSLAPFPLLATIAARHDSLVVAPLVARVGVVGNNVLVSQFTTLAQIAPGRVIAALGTGDKLSEEENIAYGLAVLSAGSRREMMVHAATELGATMPVWIGAGASATNVLARDLGAELNLWDRRPEEVAALGHDGPVNWAGNARDDLEVQLDELAHAGSTWAIFAPGVDVARLVHWRRGTRESQ